MQISFLLTIHMMDRSFSVVILTRISLMYVRKNNPLGDYCRERQRKLPARAERMIPARDPLEQDEGSRERFQPHINNQFIYVSAEQHAASRSERQPRKFCRCTCARTCSGEIRIISIENTCWMPSHRAVTNCIVYSINVSTATCEKVEKGDKVSVYLLQKALYIMKRAAPTSVRRKKERIGVCIGYGKSPPHYYIKGPIHYEKSPIFYSDK